MFNFFHSFAIGIISAFVAFAGAFHHSPQIQPVVTGAPTTSIEVYSKSNTSDLLMQSIQAHGNDLKTAPIKSTIPPPSTAVSADNSANDPSDNIICGGVSWPIKSICNQGYKPRCTTGTSVICDPIGTSDNQGTQNVIQQQQAVVPTPPANSTLCNGTYYSHCPAGENFECPGDGGSAYCKPPQQTTNSVQQQTQSQTVSNQAQQDADAAAARAAKLAPLLTRYTQVINDINADCRGADSGRQVSQCELTESKLLTILQQEAAIGISVQEAAPELSALQDAYNKLQVEYYSDPGGVDEGYYEGTRNNIAAEMRILGNYEAMFAGQ